MTAEDSATELARITSVDAGLDDRVGQPTGVGELHRMAARRLEKPVAAEPAGYAWMPAPFLVSRQGDVLGRQDEGLRYRQAVKGGELRWFDQVGVRLAHQLLEGRF